MTIRWGERPKQTASVEFGREETSREYWVSGTYERKEALVTIGDASPSVDESVDAAGNPVGIFRKSIEAREEGGGVWTVMVKYANTPDQFEIRFNNGTQTSKMHVALETIRVYDCIDGGFSQGDEPTDNVPSFGGAIGVSSEGGKIKVEGLDREIGKMEFSVTAKMKFATLDAGYEYYLGTVTPSVNDALWSFVWKTQLFAFPRGSIKFRGHTTNQNSADELEITHNFAYSKPLAPISYETWTGGRTFQVGEEVTYLGVEYKSILAPNLNHAPVDLQAWSSVRAYVVADVVSYGGRQYTAADTSTNSQPDITPADWTDNGVYYWVRIADASFRISNSDPIEKEGWEYGWPWFRPDVQANEPIVVPAGFVIQRIYEYANFGLFQLGF